MYRGLSSLFFGLSMIFFFLSCYYYPTNFWYGQLCTVISVILFFIFVFKFFKVEEGGEDKKMIRYQCSECGEYYRGGVEDKECPLCKGTLIFKEIV